MSINFKKISKLCKVFDIKYPIIQAGMSGPSTPDLVAAVSNAGGIGILGSDSFTPEELLEKIKTIRKLTKNPFGINVLLVKSTSQTDIKQYEESQQFLNKIRNEIGIQESSRFKKAIPILSDNSASNDIEEKIKIMIEERIPLFSFGLGDASPYIKKIQSYSNSKIMSMVTTVDEAIQIANDGVDIIVAQGGEAGGHRSSITNNFDSDIPLIGTMALVPQVADALQKIQKDKKVMTIAAGGIIDGRGVVAALCLGASGVSMGTRFLLSKESLVFQGYKDKLLGSKETDTVITDVYSGMPARSIKNDFIKKYQSSESAILPWPLQWLSAQDIYEYSSSHNIADYYPILAGQAVRLLKQDQSASDIIKEIINEANDVTSFISQ
ncbi:MAG: nitronate monooxygenase [Candidatus Nitrosocosmicus sp.]|nr:nitronate monooxygenase [Candidatus Nitrosocosmicus sp.]